jgi:hypothetical protein
MYNTWSGSWCYKQKIEMAALCDHDVSEVGG